MKSTVRSLILALTLAAADLLGTATSAHAQSGTPQSPYVITGPTKITRSGYYILGQNINYPGTSGNIIEIAASNVTLDFNGFYIAGAVGTTRARARSASMPTSRATSRSKTARSLSAITARRSAAAPTPRPTA